LKTDAAFFKTGSYQFTQKFSQAQEVGTFVQFRYEPSYLEGYPKLQSDPKTVCSSLNLETVPSKINLDGGNIVKWND
jgi:agmatine deiminase